MGFSGYGLMPPSVPAKPVRRSGYAFFWFGFFVEGKFYSIFSFLFVSAFACKSRGRKSAGLEGLAIQTAFVLALVIGLLTPILLWSGDILSIYALTALHSFCFAGKQTTALLKWAFALLAIPILTYLLLYILVCRLCPAWSGGEAGCREMIFGRRQSEKFRRAATCKCHWL